MTDSTSDIPDPVLPQPARRLQLNTHVTADFLARVEPELVSVFLDCLMSSSGRFYDSKSLAALFMAVKLLSAFGLALSLYLVMMGGAIYRSVRLDLVLAAFFCLMLFWYWNKEKSVARIQARYQRVWRWLARKQARRILKVAFKTAPFDAEYDLRDDWLAYYRSKNGKYAFAWARQLSGLRVTGNGFTLFYKKKVTIHPHAIVLHDPSAALASYLNASGVRNVGRSAPRPDS
jgi:hypothetical protein